MPLHPPPINLGKFSIQLNLKFLDISFFFVYSFSLNARGLFIGPDCVQIVFFDKRGFKP